MAVRIWSSLTPGLVSPSSSAGVPRTRRMSPVWPVLALRLAADRPLDAGAQILAAAPIDDPLREVVVLVLEHDLAVRGRAQGEGGRRLTLQDGGEGDDAVLVLDPLELV